LSVFFVYAAVAFTVVHWKVWWFFYFDSVWMDQ